MNEFISHSQAGQDTFVHAILVKGMGFNAGTFLDIGANDPIKLSNSYALERMGWRGLLVDNDDHVMELCTETRPGTPFFRVDATQFNFRGMLPTVFSGFVIDYLSLDVDAATPLALENLLQAPFRYRVATVEHDVYRFGPKPRARIRELMEGQGYVAICRDVMHDGCPFEDWWVDPAQVDLAAAKFYECDGVDGRVIVK